MPAGKAASLTFDLQCDRRAAVPSRAASRPRRRVTDVPQPGDGIISGIAARSANPSRNAGSARPGQAAVMERLKLVIGIDYFHKNLRRFMRPTRRHLALPMRMGSALPAGLPAGNIPRGTGRDRSGRHFGGGGVFGAPFRSSSVHGGTAIGGAAMGIPMQSGQCRSDLRRSGSCAGDRPGSGQIRRDVRKVRPHTLAPPLVLNVTDDMKIMQDMIPGLFALEAGPMPGVCIEPPKAATAACNPAEIRP